MAKQWRRSPAIVLIAALAGLLLVATTLAVPTGAAATTFTSVTVLANDFIADPTGANTSLLHNVPNLRVSIDGTFQDATFKDHYNSTGAADR